METDFELYGLALDHVVVERRWSLLTLDFEEFHSEDIALWAYAMRRWAEASRLHQLPFSFFIAVENVVQLRAGDPAGYRDFLDSVRRLHEAGTVFYPHNHYLFDPTTGSRPPGNGPPPRSEGYRHRPCMFYDVVYRHGADWRSWLQTLTRLYENFLRDAGLPRPARMTFRPGGWDHGSTEADLSEYLAGLGDAGYEYNSSALPVASGTRWSRGAVRFGRNVFRLKHGLIEIAPSWWFDCGADVLSRPFWGSVSRLARQPELWAQPRRSGAAVTVLHFHHLFRTARAPGEKSVLDDRERISRRIDRSFRRLDALRRLLRLTCTTFDDVSFIRHQQEA